MKKKLILLLTANVLGGYGLSQNQSTLHLHVPVPVSNFGSGLDNYQSDGSLPNNEFGYASTGLGIGYTFDRFLNEKGLFATASLDLYWNRIKGKVRNGFDLESDGTHEYTFPDYFTLPLSFGIGYEQSINDKLILGTRLTPIINVLKVSKSEHTHYFTGSLGDFSKRTCTYETSTSLGFGIGLHATLHKQWTLGLRYAFLGNHTFEKYNTKTDENNNVYEDTYTRTKSIAIVSFSLGYLLSKS